MGLSPVIVGAIAHGDPWCGGADSEDVGPIIGHGLAFAACQVADPRALAQWDPQGRLTAAARQQVRRSIAVAATASRVHQLLADRGLGALTYKGPALAVQTTGSWRGRGSTDVDVLVDLRDSANVDRALRSAGCRSRAGYVGPPTPWERYHRQERAYLGLPVTIDLHWRLDSGPGYFTAAFDDLWSRRETIMLDGLEVDTLDRVDALLATSVHGAKERWNRWRWALDAVRQVEALPPEAWPVARARASGYGAVRALDLCLDVVALCGGVVPPEHEGSRRMRDLAAEFLDESGGAETVEWSNAAALRRRRARWLVADGPVAAVDGFARSLARLAHDRRAPGSPQQRRA